MGNKLCWIRVKEIHTASQVKEQGLSYNAFHRGIFILFSQ